MVRRFGMPDVWGVDCSCCDTVARPCAIQSGRRPHPGYAECPRRRPSRSPDRGRGGRAGGCSKVRNFYQGRHLLSIWPRSDGVSGAASASTLSSPPRLGSACFRSTSGLEVHVGVRFWPRSGGRNFFGPLIYMGFLHAGLCNMINIRHFFSPQAIIAGFPLAGFKLFGAPRGTKSRRL
jgi:hypothetical protein